MKALLPRKLIILFIMVFLTSSLFVSGCSTSKKPLPNTTNKPQITAPTPTTPNTNNPGTTSNSGTNTTTTTSSKQVTDMAVKEANMVTGVRGATAVVLVKNLYVGLDLDANLQNTMTTNIEKSVLNRVKKAEPNYTVVVTSDMDTVTRLKGIAKGVAQGKPISSFQTEFNTINSRMKTMTK